MLSPAYFSHRISPPSSSTHRWPYISIQCCSNNKASLIHASFHHTLQQHNMPQRDEISQPPPKPSSFLSIPIELRIEIYKLLLILPVSAKPSIHHKSTTSSNNKQKQHHTLHPAILSTSRQTHHEALPILYQHNIFLAHPLHLTSLPRLRPWYPPHTNQSLIRRWHLPLQLDLLPPPWSVSAITSAFSHADELVLSVWQAVVFAGPGAEALRRFEGVRGVRRARVLGCPGGFERYVAWMEGVMMMEGDEGVAVGEYQCVDETERKRLSGWV
ncbi:hypothetical protein B0T17DRAFT_39919 [Bombardia bombarda]|uniref:Uncharacterized protein n=1 Tax=Bombardia bombarda TaxID=252184 RepID=A0AA40CE30_9PEZI|nr:hypothetical protein B0T17DRAFT_39919 [Bombardia bombarda]